MIVKDFYKNPKLVEDITKGLRELNIYMDENTLHRERSFCGCTIKPALQHYLPAGSTSWLGDSSFVCGKSRDDECKAVGHCCLWGYAYARFGEAMAYCGITPLSITFSECHKCCQPCAMIQAVAQIGRGEEVHFEN